VISVVVLILLAAAPPQGGAAAAFDRAVQALSSGDLKGAETGFQQVLKSQPNSVPALGNLGVTYNRMERYADAIKIFQRALKLAPREPGLLLNLAIAHVKRGDHAAAKPLLSHLPPTPQTRQLLATCELFTGHPQRAIDLLEDEQPSPETLFIRGTAHLHLKQRDEARAAFDRLFTIAPPAQVHLLLGRAYAESTLFEEALPELRRAVQLDPASVPARLELAKTLISMRDNDAAETELRTLLKANPLQPGAAYYLGALLVQQGKEDEALPLLQQSRAAKPDGWGSYYYLGRAWMQKDQAPKAVPLLEKASTLNPGESAVWFQLARAYHATGQPAKAKAAREKQTAILEKSLAKESEIIPPNH
jgi:predicted Zn-dependent protease